MECFFALLNKKFSIRKHFLGNHQFCVSHLFIVYHKATLLNSPESFSFAWNQLQLMHDGNNTQPFSLKSSSSHFCGWNVLQAGASGKSRLCAFLCLYSRLLTMNKPGHFKGKYFLCFIDFRPVKAGKRLH